MGWPGAGAGGAGAGGPGAGGRGRARGAGMSSCVTVSSADPGSVGTKERPIAKGVFAEALVGPLTNHFMHTREVWQKVTPTLVLYPAEKESAPSGNSDMPAVSKSIQTVLQNKVRRAPASPAPIQNERCSRSCASGASASYMRPWRARR